MPTGIHVFFDRISTPHNSYTTTFIRTKLLSIIIHYQPLTKPTLLKSSTFPFYRDKRNVFYH